MDTEISADDIQDVQELTTKLFLYMKDMLNENDLIICRNAFLGAFASAIFTMSESEEEVGLHCAMLIELLEGIIKEVKSQAQREGKN